MVARGSGGPHVPFYIANEMPNFGVNNGDADSLVALIRKEVPPGVRIAAIVFDTLARTMVGQNDSDSAAMSMFVENCNSLQLRRSGASQPARRRHPHKTRQNIRMATQTMTRPKTRKPLRNSEEFRRTLPTETPKPPPIKGGSRVSGVSNGFGGRKEGRKKMAMTTTPADE